MWRVVVQVTGVEGKALVYRLSSEETLMARVVNVEMGVRKSKVRAICQHEGVHALLIHRTDHTTHSVSLSSRNKRHVWLATGWDCKIKRPYERRHRSIWDISLWNNSI